MAGSGSVLIKEKTEIKKRMSWVGRARGRWANLGLWYVERDLEESCEGRGLRHGVLLGQRLLGRGTAVGLIQSVSALAHKSEEMEKGKEPEFSEKNPPGLWQGRKSSG